ncbi:MAG TPA: hypothetical protein VEL76_36465, partial [Gemmataceae bacterium]|nr:hypothetical protein [Gemmataceae bacterium]
MTAPATPPDTPRFGRLVAGLCLIAMLLGGIAITFTGGGCSKPPPPLPDQGSGPKGDPWVVAAARLKKETDLAA